MRPVAPRCAKVPTKVPTRGWTIHPPGWSFRPRLRGRPPVRLRRLLQMQALARRIGSDFLHERVENPPTKDEFPRAFLRFRPDRCQCGADRRSAVRNNNPLRANLHLFCRSANYGLESRSAVVFNNDEAHPRKRLDTSPEQGVSRGHVRRCWGCRHSAPDTTAVGGRQSCAPYDAF